MFYSKQNETNSAGQIYCTDPLHDLPKTHIRRTLQSKCVRSAERRGVVGEVRNLSPRPAKSSAKSPCPSLPICSYMLLYAPICASFPPYMQYPRPLYAATLPHYQYQKASAYIKEIVSAYSKTVSAYRKQ